MTAVVPARPQAATDPSRGPVIALIGNPNTGKSTLFNALTGLRQKTANYPGVTVERHTGTLALDGRDVALVDLPGTYALSAHSPDEMVAVDVLLGHVTDIDRPRVVLAVVDATNLRRNLFLVTQLAELGLPLVVALNLWDVARERGIRVDAVALGRRLNATVVPVSAARSEGLDDLRAALAAALGSAPPPPLAVLPDVAAAAGRLWSKVAAAGSHLRPFEVERALIDAGGVAERRFELSTAPEHLAELADLRARLSLGSSLAAMEAKARYEFVGRLLADCELRPAPVTGLASRVDRLTNHPVLGIALFLFVMAAVFQAVFSWATPLMDIIEAGTAATAGAVRALLPPGAVASLLVDGGIAGVGSVIVFLPQILILFAFIIVLEDSGYMPRVAFMVDRLMRAVGLSGQSFIPMLSSFACAVPGIMATRVIPERRDRLATILAAPFMTCSARLPVYALLIGAFVPDQRYLAGLLNLQGLVLLGLYLLGIAGGVLTALLVKRTVLRGPTPTFLIELPPYRLPNLRSVLLKLLERGRVFLIRAGTVIFTVAVLIWALAYFPRPEVIGARYASERAMAEANLPAPMLAGRLAEIDQDEAQAYLAQSWLGRLGQVLAPAFAPLGWDWKLTAAVVAGFPAREVVIAILGTIYAVGDTGDGDALVERLRTAERADGSQVFSTGTAAGLLIFYAFCLQCAATLAVMYRETNGWVWPLGAWLYMTGLGYLGALLAYRVLG